MNTISFEHLDNYNKIIIFCQKLADGYTIIYENKWGIISYNIFKQNFLKRIWEKSISMIKFSHYDIKNQYNFYYFGTINFSFNILFMNWECRQSSLYDLIKIIFIELYHIMLLFIFICIRIRKTKYQCEKSIFLILHFIYI